jgi:homoserine kinase type II
MSVFTPITLDEARALIATYDVGEIIDFQDIAAGVENSNFFLTTNVGRYVLTIFEKIPRSDLDFYMGLMSHLHGKDIPCAAPIKNRRGEILSSLKDKPAALVARLRGGDIAHPTASRAHARCCERLHTADGQLARTFVVATRGGGAEITCHAKRAGVARK